MYISILKINRLNTNKSNETNFYRRYLKPCVLVYSDQLVQNSSTKFRCASNGSTLKKGIQIIYDDDADANDCEWLIYYIFISKYDDHREHQAFNIVNICNGSDEYIHR